MAIPLEFLQTLASTFSTVLDGPSDVAPGSVVRVKLTPSSVEGVRVTDLIEGSFNLTWITKNVRFKDPDTEPVFDAEPFNSSSVDTLLEGGMPTRLPVVGNLVGTQELPGIPGELSQLAGTFPIAVEVPVTVSIKWEIIGFGGNSLPEGPDTFTALNGLSSPDASFIIVPPIVELNNTVSVSEITYFIRATITLTAGATTHSQLLPDIPINLAFVKVPKLIVFFLHKNFAAVDGDTDGAAFIVVPHNSPLHSLTELQATLNALESTLSSLSSIISLAGFLLGLSELTSALTAQPHVQFRVANLSDEFNNFNDVTLKKKWHWLFGWRSTEAEDELSSLIFIGLEKSQIDCFIDRNRRGPRFTLTTGAAMHVVVRDLHSKSPVSQPLGNEIDTHSSSRSFGDELSSLKFL